MPQAIKNRKAPESENKEWGSWANLTGNLLVSIIFRLGFLDSVAIGGVCKRWREIVEDDREMILERQRPLVLVKPSHTKMFRGLYSMNDQTVYKTILPSYLTYWHHIGLSCGYLIMVNCESKFWLFNLITRKELHFPALPEDHFLTLDGSVPMLIYSTEISDYFLLVVNRELRTLTLARNGGSTWRTIPYNGKRETFIDVTFFKKDVYVLTVDGNIGRLRVTPCLNLELLDVKTSIPESSLLPMRFATSKDRLLMVSTILSYGRVYVIHKLDESNMVWVKVNDLGNDAVFLSHTPGCTAIVKPAKWGACSNRIHLLRGKGINRCYVFSLNRYALFEKDQTVVPETLVPLSWYFPHLCYTRNDIGGSFEM